MVESAAYPWGSSDPNSRLDQIPVDSPGLPAAGTASSNQKATNNIPLENPEDWLKLKHSDRAKDLWSLKKIKTVVFCGQLRTAANGCGVHFVAGESYQL